MTSPSTHVAADRLVTQARSQLGLSDGDLRVLVSAAPGSRSGEDDRHYQALASLADTVLERRRYTEQVVNGFYTSARRGERGEATFEGGVAALDLHGYPSEVVAALPSEVTSRFLGLGNVWEGLPSPTGMRVVDVGCGAGLDLAVGDVLAGNGVALVGVDKRPDLLRIAAAACPDASLVVGDVFSPPFTEGAFDVVLANGLPPLQRPVSLAATAATLCSLAAPGGIVSATVIVASPLLIQDLEHRFPADEPAFVRGLATLMSGKPTDHDVATAFTGTGTIVGLLHGSNPYLDESTRRLTAMVHVTAHASRGAQP
ncbi:class I SAM-dependent methyltransferase [Nocardioides sp. W7]|uniref:class I SAM-dependent methyltransferase n=1 Tax=Nocardioides sp. W7 TaxID=2931390 RepID=UPI001FD5B435|nr:class I SAM-dependent methyltransferase [Nocardioides sp. W7]